jgi:hypothetical protein
LVGGNSTNKSFYYGLAGIAFLLNWIWEMSQMFAYRAELEKSWRETVLFCTLATIIDVLVVLIIHSALKKFTGLRGWKFYLTAALLGAVCALLFEKIAFAFGLWGYNERMPVVPFLRTGVLPFAQLLILVPLSIWLAERFSERRSSA